MLKRPASGEGQDELFSVLSAGWRGNDAPADSAVPAVEPRNQVSVTVTVVSICCDSSWSILCLLAVPFALNCFSLVVFSFSIDFITD